MSRPKNGPGMAARLATYRSLRERHLTYDQAAAEMGVTRDAIRWYAKALRENGDLPPARPPKPTPPPQEPRRDAAREAVLGHLLTWPSSLFSAWDLGRVLGLCDASVRRVLRQLVAEGVAKQVDGTRYPSDQRVPARRYQLAANENAVVGRG
ncbi:hypothetical protein ACIBG7_15125 [Nonomuraea sp. NPDC050328]|uniref:hypothetical protein n=1 Tax=Nonomuraea sp. NPDC050328 TaxID=3364361 RepID=UPI0037942A54